ncbi:hypothetical protein K9N68_18790 [Kovacikia minuta CCNUW1]|uniref:hypothetical protein n=1 Tax=Kovacikia minuta TaxID=2931930 RepID=UPI001CCDB8E4|nr:hypothetical protein [Kovacikia minuta]UBF23803.1 hypothetical protein K9N68_18790 [Kovacikia minuta CCNUW1]
MQITIQLPDDLKQHLIHQATQLNVSLETFILQSLRQLSQSSSNNIASQWSETVLSYTGTPDLPAFESYRDDLLPSREPELF